MQSKKLIILSIITFVLISLSSCYDSVEVDDMVYILAIGVDELTPEQLRYTFQIAVPLGISNGVETNFTESDSSISIQNINIVSNDMLSAIEKANKTLAKEINVSHCKLLLFSENVSNDTLKNNINITNSHEDFSPNTLIAMCEGTSSDYLASTSSPFEKNPARYYTMYFKKKFSLDTFSTEVNEFEKLDTLILPLLCSNADTKAVIIDSYKNISVLSHEETFALNLLTGKLNKGYITILESGTTVEIYKTSNPKIQVSISENQPIFKIKLKFHGNNPGTEDVPKIKKQLESQIKDICQKLLYKSSETLNTDIAGLTKFSKPRFMTTKAYENYNWKNKYKNAKFEVAVNYEIIK